ncbi:DUF3483 domain-containing protein [Undibacterium arcticum]
MPSGCCCWAWRSARDCGTTVALRELRGAVCWRFRNAIFVDLHHVVAREPFIARSHVAVAGGAVLAILVIAINYGLALYSPLLDRVLLAASALMLTGSALMAWRRRAPPTRLSRGPWMRLPFTLAVFLPAVPVWPHGGRLPAARLRLSSSLRCW